MNRRTKSQRRPGIKPQRPLLENAWRMIELRLDALLAYDAFVSQEEAVTELHEMRIAAKRLRYTLEIFADVYAHYSSCGAEYDALIDEVKLVQEQLGSVHDADILVPEMTAYLADLIALGQDTAGVGWLPGVHHVDYDACAGLLSLCRQTGSARDRHYRDFVATWKRLQDTGRFTELRDLLRGAANAMVKGANVPPTQEQSQAAITLEAIIEDTGNGRQTESDSAPAGDTGPRSLSRKTRRRGGKTNSAKDGARHSGVGAHPGAGIDEGRIE